MKKEHTARFGFASPRTLLGFLLCLGLSFSAHAFAQPPQENSGIQFGKSYHNDVSPALRDLPTIWPPRPPKDRELREANLNTQLPLSLHIDMPDAVIDHG